MVHAQELKELSGPVYDLDRKHHFQELIKNAYELKQLQGPVYMKKDGEHKYVAESPISSDMLQMNQPVRAKEIGGKNQFTMDTPNPNNKPDPLRTFSMNVMPGVIAKNMFQPTEISEDVSTEMEKVMAAPTYGGIHIRFLELEAYFMCLNLLFMFILIFNIYRHGN